MKNTITSLFIFILLFACKVKEPVKSNPEIVTPKPSWVTSRPINSLDYIGIGLAKKNPGVNYIESAKNNALSDLASEIKVNLESNTIYFQSERNGLVNEDFKSTIKTTAAAEIEGYELVASWQDETEYWVYYSLSKADYLKRIEDKRLNAKKTSLDHLKNAETSQENGDIKLAIQQYFDAFSAIKVYPPSSIETEVNGTTTSLDNLIYTNTQALLSNIEFINSDEKIELEFANGYSKHLNIFISYKGKSAVGIPVIQQYESQYGPITQTSYTDEKGVLDVFIKAKSLKPSQLKTDLYFDMKKLIGNREDAAYLEQKITSLIPPSYSINAVVSAPAIYVTNDERVFGNQSGKSGLKSIIVSELVKEGVQLVDKLEKADLSMDIKADTKLQSKDADFTVVGLNYALVITEIKTKKIVLALEEGPVKGVSLDESRAAVKAYEKAESDLKRIEIKKIRSAILDF